MEIDADDAQRAFLQCQDAVTRIVATLKQNEAFFATRTFFLFMELRLLVHACRQHQRDGAQLVAQTLLQQTLLRLFGIHVDIPSRRHLSILAALIRYLQVNSLRMHLEPPNRGGIDLLVRDLNQRLEALSLRSKVDLILVNRALNNMTEYDATSVCVIELRYFARLGVRDIALELAFPIEMVETELRIAKAWVLSSVQDYAQY